MRDPIQSQKDQIHAGVRYITLEKGMSEEDASRTALCEWQHSEEGVSHLNFGDGPPPDVFAFIRKIAEMTASV